MKIFSLILSQQIILSSQWSWKEELSRATFGQDCVLMVYTASELLLLLTWVMGLGVSAALRQVDSVELGQLVAGVCCSDVHFR